MKSVVALVSFKLNEDILVEDWKKMSDGINQSLQNVEGFIYRDSAISDDGNVYCILKWESAEKQEAFLKTMKGDEFKNEMDEFARLVNMETMKSEVLKVI